MLAAVNGWGYANTYDCVFVPMPKCAKDSNKAMQVAMGYMFVNFKTSVEAEAFIRNGANNTMPGRNSTKVCIAEFSQEQGADIYIEKHSSGPGVLLTFADGQMIVRSPC